MSQLQDTDPINEFLVTSHRPLKFRESNICKLLFEDRYILVVDKQAGFLTHPTDKLEPKTVRSALNRYITSRYKKKSNVIAVHRLDRGTSGILVFAKDDITAEKLIDQFRDRKPKRIYLAILAGQLKEPSGRIESHLYTDQFLNQRSTEDESKGKIAITNYEIIWSTKTASFAKISLETGRRNQIRVHFGEQKHPVLGDVRYQSELAEHKHWPYKRLALHAATLGFTHPVTREQLEFSSRAPEEFLRFRSAILRKPHFLQKTQA